MSSDDPSEGKGASLTADSYDSTQDLSLRRIRIVCISDTHKKHRKLDVPDGDILIHAGDFTQWGMDRSKDVKDFDEWLGTLPHKHKLLIHGNHEHPLYLGGKLEEMITNARYVSVGACTIEGIRIYCCSWPFESKHVIQPCEVLVTHEAPEGVLGGSGFDSEEILKRVTQLAPAVHIFGHYHFARGTAVVHKTLCVNCAVDDGKGGVHAPYVLEVTQRVENGTCTIDSVKVVES